MEWNMMEPYGSSYSLGYQRDGAYVPYEDCEEILDEMIDVLLNENQKTLDVRRRMALEKVVEKDLIPMLKACSKEEYFSRAVKLMANLTQPCDMCDKPGVRLNSAHRDDVNRLINSAKYHCADLDFLKALGGNMKEILRKESLGSDDCHCLNHCVLLLRNLIHVRPGTSTVDQASIVHQCLISSFFINEMDKVIHTMINHKYKETWTVGVTQLIFFVFKDFLSLIQHRERYCTKRIGASLCQSSSLLEPDVDDTTSTSSSDEHQDAVEVISSSTSEHNVGSSADRTLSSNFKNKLQIYSSSENSACLLEDDDFMVELKSTSDCDLEIKLPNCPQRTGSADSEEMDMGESASKSPTNLVTNMRGNNPITSSGRSSKEADTMREFDFQVGTSEKEVLSLINQSSCLMDIDILVSYLQKFATDILYSGFVDLVENIMKALLTKYDSIFDHSFLMWTVGFFLSFAHQQELDFAHFKEVLNLDLFGFLVYEGVKCCQDLEVKHQKKQDLSVEKHRLHLVVCTLNQMFRTLLVNSKMEYLINLQKCLSCMADLRNLFLLLIRHHLTNEQSSVYLRDLVQTNHVLMLIIEEWMSYGFIAEHCGFSMLDHVKQFATKSVMAKYGSLLEHQDLSKETVNVAVLTMMYHVVGDCKRQDTLMQLPILKSFSEIWMENAVREKEEFKDLIEFVLEVFMSDTEKDPDMCAQNLFDSTKCQQTVNSSSSTSDIGSGSCSRDIDNNCSSTDSSMNISSTCSNDEFSEEEQVLVFTWMSELMGTAGLVNIITKKLSEHGFSKTKEQVSKYLVDSGFIDDLLLPSSPSISSTSNMSSHKDKKTDFTSLENNILHELSSVPDDHLVQFLVDKLKKLRFGPQLIWLQKQLLEAAYVKLGIKDQSYRIHVEEPVAKFYALQNKPIPMIPWNGDLDEALANPYFHLLQQCLGLYTNDDPNFIYPRIPQYLTPSLLVNKAQQIGSIESVPMKFDVNTLKEGTDLDIMTDKPLGKFKTKNIDIYRSLKTVDHTWLSVIQKMNGDYKVGSI